MNIVIHEANEKDHLNEILRMRLDLEKHNAESSADYWILDREVYLNSCKNYLNDENSKVHIALSAEGDQIIGMGISVIDYHKDSPVEITGNIHHLWVDPECRNLNVGKLIVKEIIKHFKSKGVQQLILDYVDGNVEGEKFWTKMGYKPIMVVCSNTIENLESKL